MLVGNICRLYPQSFIYVEPRLTLDSWLNEGWTTYLERRIQGAIHGEAHRDFSAIIGWKALRMSRILPVLDFTDALNIVGSVERYGEDHEFTKLVVDLVGKDPDDAFSSIPYEKVCTYIPYHFSCYLISALGLPLPLLS